MLRSLGLGLHPETFAKFLRVSDNLVSEKNLGFGKFGPGEKSWFQFQKFWYRKKSLGFGFEKIWYRKKKSRFRKIWYRKKSLNIGFGQNFGIFIQCMLN